MLMHNVFPRKRLDDNAPHKKLLTESYRYKSLIAYIRRVCGYSWPKSVLYDAWLGLKVTELVPFTVAVSRLSIFLFESNDLVSGDRPNIYWRIATRFGRWWTLSHSCWRPFDNITASQILCLALLMQRRLANVFPVVPIVEVAYVSKSYLIHRKIPALTWVFPRIVLETSHEQGELL
jgi:hypothetical protein